MPITRTAREGKAGAIFSDCERYRYVLWRIWEEESGEPQANMLAFIGLNPSTATEGVIDSTVIRCINYAKRWGYDGMYMLNLFGWRSTNPRVLAKVDDPVGPDNDRNLVSICAGAPLIVAAWGTHGVLLGRHRRVLDLLRDYDLQCLGTTKAGFPRHPLFLRGDVLPQPYLWSD